MESITLRQGDFVPVVVTRNNKDEVVDVTVMAGMDMDATETAFERKPGQVGRIEVYEGYVHLRGVKDE